jgi:hypothetical protein
MPTGQTTRWAEGRSDVMVKRKITAPLWDTTLVVQNLASCYTDFDIPAKPINKNSATNQLTPERTVPN